VIALEEGVKVFETLPFEKESERSLHGCWLVWNKLDFELPWVV
jgi:hypothetical protein